MTSVNDMKALLLNPKEFFALEETKLDSLKFPVIITAVYAIIVAIAAYVTSGTAADMIGMPEMAGILGVVGVITGLLSVFVGWVFMAVVFFIFVKFITHTETPIRPFLAVTGYASLPLLVGSLLTLIVGFFISGIFDGWLGFLLNLLILLWCLPIWLYGFSAATKVPVNLIFKAILIPVVLMILMGLYGTYTGLEALNQMESGGLQVQMGPPR